MRQTISILVKGKVQGVFYRQNTKEMAQRLGISGQVKNLPGGNVQVIATGTKEQLDKLIEWCRHGPSRAIVTDIHSEELPLQEFSHFTIVRS
jgi:acylphosphatase